MLSSQWDNDNQHFVYIIVSWYLLEIITRQGFLFSCSCMNRCTCRLLQQSAPGIRAVCFKSPSRQARHGCPSTARPHGPLWQTSETIGVRNPCRLFQKFIPAARHGQPPTTRSDRLLKQSAWGIRAVCFKSPFRRPVMDVRHGPLSRTSETNGAPYGRNWVRLVFMDGLVPFDPNMTTRLLMLRW